MKSYLHVPIGADHEEGIFDLTPLSPFQVETLREIVSADDFDFACHREISGKGDTVVLLYYTTDGFMHARKVSRTKVVWKFEGSTAIRSVDES